MKKNTRRILAIIGIALLLAMYLINLVLALIGSEEARNMLKVTMVMSIMIPILLYAILMLTKNNDKFYGGPREELTPEQKEEAWQRMLEEDSLPQEGRALEAKDTEPAAEPKE